MIHPRQPFAVRAAPLPQAPIQPASQGGRASDEVDRLIERAQRGDQKAFADLYNGHLRQVYGYVRLQVGDDATAEDLTQDVFMSLLRGLRTFRRGQAFTPWLMRVAHNRVANHWRSQGRRPQTVSLPEPDGPDEDQRAFVAPERTDGCILDISREELGRALGRLTDLQRQVILLRFGAELSLAETAAVVGRSVNAVKNIEFKALVALRRQLKPQGGTG